MASGVTVRVEIDEKKLEHAIFYAPKTEVMISNKVEKIAAKANALAGGYRTPKWHDHDTGETKGDTPAVYEGDTQLGRKGYIGIVYPNNYAAQKENKLHNTLLKAKG